VGQLQRLALARTLLRAPELLLLDDLLTGLDPVSAETVLRSLHAFAQEHLVVVVAPSELAWRRCDELLITEAGRLVAQTTPDDAARDPKLASLLFAGASVAA
jgi:ABC-type bacteriocin/lantibiotic exporter with double-glycine peptidase domain